MLLSNFNLKLNWAYDFNNVKFLLGVLLFLGFQSGNCILRTSLPNPPKTFLLVGLMDGFNPNDGY